MLKIRCCTLAAFFLLLLKPSSAHSQSEERVDHHLIPTGQLLQPAGEAVAFPGRPVDLVGSPFHVSTTGEPAAPPPARLPPGLGQDTQVVLRKLCGLDEAALRELHEKGVIG